MGMAWMWQGLHVHKAMPHSVVVRFWRVRRVGRALERQPACGRLPGCCQRSTKGAWSLSTPATRLAAMGISRIQASVAPGACRRGGPHAASVCLSLLVQNLCVQSPLVGGLLVRSLSLGAILC